MLLLMAFGGAFQHAIRRLNRNFVLHTASSSEQTDQTIPSNLPNRTNFDFSR